MASIKLSCSCGAEIFIQGKDVFSCTFPYKDFLKEHYICRKHGVRKQWEEEDEKGDLEGFGLALRDSIIP